MYPAVDILAFGAHPDDVEIGAGGILAKHHSGGFKTAVCNLTEAERSSNGTIEDRRIESALSASILGVEHVINLGIPDRGITHLYMDKIIQTIRLCKPKIILAPYWKDRHPDHISCSNLIREATFDAALQKIIIDGTSTHRVERVFYYFLNTVDKADIIIDISDVYEKKMEALGSYSSQFDRNNGDVDTPINQSGFLDMIRGRDQLWGHQAGVRFGEALICSHPYTPEWLCSR